MITRRGIVVGAFAGCCLLCSCSQFELQQGMQGSGEKSTKDRLSNPGVFDVEALRERLGASEDVFLLDVRDPAELAEIGAIEGYVNIPMNQLEMRMSEIPKDRPTVLY